MCKAALRRCFRQTLPQEVTYRGDAFGRRRRMSRAPLRAAEGSSGRLNSLFDQDRSLWDQALIGEGLQFLEFSAKGSELTEYHVEAAIAAVHATARSTTQTDWGEIVSLYDTLISIRPSPVVALNRAIAIGQRDGPERGLEELQAIADSQRLTNYPFYHAAFGESELQLGRTASARQHFSAALGLSRNPMERQFFEQRLEATNNCPLPPRSNVLGQGEKNDQYIDKGP
jgi:predicted RNA polymerase sigma factor